MPTIVPCPACRTGLLARRGDPLCLTCMKAAREMPPRPLWLFDSPLLRLVLAEVNLPAVPAIVRAACGLSQRDLATVVGWSPAVLSYYERGARDGLFDIRTALQFADAVGMPREALLPLVLADPDAGPAAGDGMGMDPSWRGSGGLAAAAGAAVVLSPASVPRTVSISHVRYWRACTDVLYAQGHAVGGTVLLAPALRQWQRVRLALKEGAAGETSRLLRAVAAEVAVSTGWVALDARCLPLARRLYEQAAGLAAGAGDAVLAVHVLTSQSLLCAEMGSASPGQELARQALRLAFQAQEEGRYLPIPKLHVLIALRHASAAALLGDKTAFQAAISQARRELDRGPRDCAPPEWLRFEDEAEITAVEARGYLNLGDTDHSVRLYQQALDCGLSPLSRVSFGAGLADALMKQDAPGEAVTAAMEALSAFEAGVTSLRCLDQLRLVRQAVGTAPSTQEFRERFDSIDRALAASSGLPGDDAPQATARIPASPHDTGTAA